MKIRMLIFVFLALIFLNPQKDYAQLKKNEGSPRISEILTTPGTSLLGFLDPSNFHMSHSVSMSYSALGGGAGMMLNSYINTIDLQLSDKLFLRTNIGIMSSPYNTFGDNYFLNKPQFFGGAELKYDFDNNSSLFFKFDIAPYQSYYNSYNPRYNNSMFSQQSFFR